MRRILALAIALAIGTGAVLLVATQAQSAKTKGTTVTTGSTKLGKILVDAQHRTLYLFEKDKRGKSACSGACAAAWPPLLTSGKPKASGKAKSKLLGTTKRSDGKRQVTYRGHPLYYFVQDKKPGDTLGQDFLGFGAKWYVLAPNGKKIDSD
jgi:predicted lipoprotein with Yx(FWY)xxD motif